MVSRAFGSNASARELDRRACECGWSAEGGPGGWVGDAADKGEDEEGWIRRGIGKKLASHEIREYLWSLGLVRERAVEPLPL